MAYKIKEIRERKKMTQLELAEKSGVSRTTLSKLENNENPDGRNIKSHCAGFGRKSKCFIVISPFSPANEEA